MTSTGGEHYGNFDAESPSPVGRPAKPGRASPSGPAKGSAPKVRVLFRCCNVYMPITIPQRVLNGELSSWRFHCPRCAGLVEIPFDD
ncbi:MAG TPA: hypothetical protein DDW52_27940 [Planctomycetaceae bacterium]|nr:hypothetical protein [Planctomycetaceae bacterium]